MVMAPETEDIQQAMTGWGYCRKCTMWRDYATGACPAEGEALFGHEQGDNLQLHKQFFPALLAVQDIDDPDVTEARRLAWYNNANVDELRRKTSVLRSIAMIHGREIVGPTPVMPKGVQTMKGPDGRDWYVRWESGAPVWLGAVQEQPAPPVAKPLTEAADDFAAPEDREPGATVVRPRSR